MSTKVKQDQVSPYPDVIDQDGIPFKAHIDDNTLPPYNPDPNATPVSLSLMLKKVGLGGPRVPAKSLVGVPIIIMSAKWFLSSFDNQDHAYFCRVKEVATGEEMCTVFGGGAVVDVLDAIAKTGLNAPIQVVLQWVTQGRYEGYYTLE